MAQRHTWQQLEALFYEASELDPQDRSAFLDERCGTDAELRAEVESLLHSADQASGFLNQPILNVVKEVASVPAVTVAPGDQIAQYAIISKLGAGGMGHVFLAQDTRLKRKVALKILSPDLTKDENALRRFEHEAQAASALNHPNILTIFEFGQVNDLHFIATELVEGPTIRQKIKTGTLSPCEAADIALQIAGALEAAHNRGITHRDIKPDNIIVRPDGLVKVLDFGIAKLTEEPVPGNSDRAPTTNAGIVLGTPKYMSPEQARGIVVDGRSDIFSLGAVLYEMICGRAPFSGKTSGDLIAEILKTEPRPLSAVVPDVPSDLETIVNKAMQKQREMRYQSAAAFSKDLLAFKKKTEFDAQLQRNPGASRSSTPAGASPVTQTPRPSELAAKADTLGRASRLIGLKWAAIAILGLAIAVGFVLFRRARAKQISAYPHSLAILPFRNLKPDPATDFLGFSLADAVITKLSSLNSLTLRPSSAVDRYRGSTTDPQKVAAELNVDTLLTGSFIKDGEDLRITTQLIDARADKILWRDAIDVKYDKLLTVQDRVSQQIIKGLALNLSPTEEQQLRPEGKIGAEAYEYYLRGVDFYSLNDFSAAVTMLEKSAELQPDYAPTWAQLGRAYTTTASLHSGGRAFYKKAQDAYERAITLNPSLIDPRIYMGNLLTDTGRIEQAVTLLRRALEAKPNSAEAHWELGYAYRFGGMLNESVAEAEQARRFDPEVKINSSALNAYLYLGQYDKFMQSLPANNSAYILFYRGFAEFHKKNFQQALQDFNSAYETDPTLLPAQVGKALSYWISHENTRGLEFLLNTERNIESRGVEDAELIFKVAEAYSVLGDNSSALRMLQRSIDGGFFCYPYFVRDPLLDSLRNHPGFTDRLEQARQRYEGFKAKFF